MGEPNWERLIEDAMQSQPLLIDATSYVKEWGSRSKPALMRCADGNDYVIKGSQNGKSLISEQVMAGLGLLIGAPMPKMLLANVPDDLIKNQRQANPSTLQHMSAGVGHGCLYLGDVEQSWIQHIDVPENKGRFIRLAVLYGWVQPADDQLHYQLSKPPLVWSVDHEGFALRNNNPARAYPRIVQDAKLQAEDVKTVRPILEAVTPAGIANAVARPHESWQITVEERVSLAEHLEQKRKELIASLT